jgi:hypothetical protein
LGKSEEKGLTRGSIWEGAARATAARREEMRIEHFILMVKVGVWSLGIVGCVACLVSRDADADVDNWRRRCWESGDTYTFTELPFPYSVAILFNSKDLFVCEISASHLDEAIVDGLIGVSKRYHPLGNI